MILIALGSNLESREGPPLCTLHAALDALAEKGILIVAVSRFYESAAWPDPSDPPFVNAVARVATDLPPAQLLKTLHGLEAEFGRVRSKRNAPRTLDLDLLDYDGRIETGSLKLPHPRLARRAFVLIPLADVAPGWRHPESCESLEKLIEALPPRERAAVRVCKA